MFSIWFANRVAKQNERSEIGRASSIMTPSTPASLTTRALHKT